MRDLDLELLYEFEQMICDITKIMKYSIRMTQIHEKRGVAVSPESDPHNASNSLV